MTSTKTTTAPPVDGAQIEWTDAAKRRVWPRRGGPLPPPKTKRRAPAPTTRVMREKLHAARANFAQWLLEKGILTDTMTEAHREVARAMQADWAKPSDRPLVLEHEALAYYWWTTHWGHDDDPHRALVEMWLDAAGVDFALHAMVRARALFTELCPDQCRAPLGGYVTEKHLHGARVIRAELASCRAATHAAASVSATAAAREGDLGTVALLSLMFPEDELLGRRAADGAWLDGLPVFSTEWIAAAGIPLDAAIRMFTENYTSLVDDYAPTALAHHGVALVPALLDAFGRAFPNRPPVGTAAALSSVVHPLVSAAFAARRGTWKKVHRIEEEYLALHPAPNS